MQLLLITTVHRNQYYHTQNDSVNSHSCKWMWTMYFCIFKQQNFEQDLWFSEVFLAYCTLCPLSTSAQKCSQWFGQQVTTLQWGSIEKWEVFFLKLQGFSYNFTVTSLYECYKKLVCFCCSAVLFFTSLVNRPWLYSYTALSLILFFSQETKSPIQELFT